MNYELAKELKEAGFPQIVREGKFLYGTPNELVIHGYEWCYAPTLSELIEACGTNFSSLLKMDRGGWWAKDFDGNLGRGYSPEEAVARLWLIMNKNG